MTDDDSATFFYVGQPKKIGTVPTMKTSVVKPLYFNGPGSGLLPLAYQSIPVAN
jgi:hypothetical protein